MTSEPHSPLLKLSSALLSALRQQASAGRTPSEAARLIRFCDAIGKYAVIRSGDRAAKLEKAIASWRDLPAPVQQEVTAAAAEQGCIAELEALVGGLSRDDPEPPKEPSNAAP